MFHWERRQVIQIWRTSGYIRATPELSSAVNTHVFILDLRPITVLPIIGLHQLVAKYCTVHGVNEAKMPDLT